jgi:hypothetical protein
MRETEMKSTTDVIALKPFLAKAAKGGK